MCNSANNSKNIKNNYSSISQDKTLIDPKTKFQAKLNTILSGVVSKLESLAKEVLPKEELDKINKNNENG